MKRAITTTNAGLAFTLEVAMLAALVYWGIATGGGTLAKVVLAVVAPAVAVAIWWAFLAAAGHPVNLPTPAEIAVKLAVFLVAALALAGTGHRTLGVVFAALAVLTVVIEYTAGT